MNFRKLILVGLICSGLILSGGFLQAQRKMTQIKGSDTMVNLVQILAEAYLVKNPRSPIAVLGGGSGTGIAALINGTCDIASHSREMKDKEIQMARDKGIEPRLFIIAVDGLSVILNENNPISKLTMDQIGAIYRGEIRNWKEVGGPDKAISLYGRQSNSGTYVFFQEFVLKKQNYSADMKQMNGNAQIVEGVSLDKQGIGYVGVGYVVDAKGNVKKGIKILNVSKDANSRAYSPLNKAAVDSGDYPIARPLYQSTAGVPQGAVLDFIKFEISPEGQKIVEREGFFPIGSAHQAENEKNLK
ncbi:MAG: phosphate ABC transporter substrate-binding protein [Candidatus Aminicenantes bacterium]|nr:phosphate ABC transporter substrate-binding protein [Candidatus Aminicenantes bacterium]